MDTPLGFHPYPAPQRTREQQRAAEIAGLRSSLAFWNSMSPEMQADSATHIGTLRMRYERLTGEG